MRVNSGILGRRPGRARALGTWAMASLWLLGACDDGGPAYEPVSMSPAPTGGSPAGGSGPGAPTVEPTGGRADSGGDGGAPPDPADAEADVPSELLASLCSYPDGSPILYDHTFGIAGEYAMELGMSCELGGFLAPLVDADPVELSEVSRYVAELTEWLRARILACPDAPLGTAPEGFWLVPSSQAAGLSRGDFHRLVALYLATVSRHDELGDGLTPEQKVEVRRRLDAWQKSAIQADQEGVTHPSASPDCIPAESG